LKIVHVKRNRLECCAQSDTRTRIHTYTFGTKEKHKAKKIIIIITKKGGKKREREKPTEEKKGGEKIILYDSIVEGIQKAFIFV